MSAFTALGSSALGKSALPVLGTDRDRKALSPVQDVKQMALVVHWLSSLEDAQSQQILAGLKPKI